MKDSVEILIVGAGPVGLMLATELRRDGVGVLLIEQMAQRSFFCKALGVTARTLEIFEDLGLVEQAIDAGVWMTGITVFNDGKLAQAMEIPTAGFPYGALSLAQFETERLLEEGLRRRGGAVAYGWSLTGLVEQADGVMAQLQSLEGHKREVRCRWLVGCDGAHSKVRHLLNLNFEGSKFPQTFLLADLDVSWKLPRGPMYRFNQTAGKHSGTSLVAVPVHGLPQRYGLSMMLPESPGAAAQDEAEETASPDFGEITERMTPLLPAGTRLSALRWSSRYRVSHRIVPSYSKDRIFLAGDSAHIHPPVGGQGMNTGLQDAHNLAWKLTFAARGIAASRLLESYSAERRPVGLDVVENTSRALNDVIAQKINLPGIRETQLLIGYRNSEIVAEERSGIDPALPSAGDRAVDVNELRRPFVAHALRLRNLIGGGKHVLLGYIENDPKELDLLADLLDLLKAATGNQAAGFAITAPGQTLPVQERIPVLTDAGAQFRSSYGAKPGMVWLIRPDGHIGWCSQSPVSSSFTEFLGRILRSVSVSARVR
jgi:2-polyprenyl-6-methoxyphenol hydroxylase-like FAD-dependent oxidoreductase